MSGGSSEYVGSFEASDEEGAYGALSCHQKYLVRAMEDDDLVDEGGDWYVSVLDLDGDPVIRKFTVVEDTTTTLKIKEQ